MKRIVACFGLLRILIPACEAAKEEFEKDSMETSAGELKITFIGHGALMFTFDGKVIHVDPVSREADYTKIPDTDLILITHDHRDHLDRKAVQEIRAEETQIVLTEICAERI